MTGEAHLSRLEKKIVDQANLLVPFCRGGRCKHVSMLVRRNIIKAVGVNSFRTDPFPAKLKKYRSPNTHAEWNAIKNFNYKRNATPIHHCTLYNIRIRPGDKLAFAFPCSACIDLLELFEIDRVIYTGDDGFFHSWTDPILPEYYAIMKRGKENAGKPFVIPTRRTEF